MLCAVILGLIFTSDFDFFLIDHAERVEATGTLFDD